MGPKRVGRDAQAKINTSFHMAKITTLTTPSFPPAFIAESIGSGTDCLIPAGLPIDLTSIVADATGKKNIIAGAIVNRLWANQATGKFKNWDGTGTPDALEEFYIVPFDVLNLDGLAGDLMAPPTGEAACNGLRWMTMIYEDRLPAYYQALTPALKLPIRGKYQMIKARVVAL